MLQCSGKFEYPADAGIEFYQYPKVDDESMGGMDWRKSKKYGEVRNWKLWAAATGYRRCRQNTHRTGGVIGRDNGGRQNEGGGPHYKVA